MKYVGVREFKQGLIGYLNQSRDEVVVLKHRKPVARLIPVRPGDPENTMIEIGMILSEAGISEKAARKALADVRTDIYGQDSN